MNNDCKECKVIDAILRYVLNEVICEPDLDMIWHEMNPDEEGERNWVRGDEEELKMLKEYFYKKAEDMEGNKNE